MDNSNISNIWINLPSIAQYLKWKDIIVTIPSTSRSFHKMMEKRSEANNIIRRIFIYNLEFSKNIKKNYNILEKMEKWHIYTFKLSHYGWISIPDNIYKYVRSLSSNWNCAYNKSNFSKEKILTEISKCPNLDTYVSIHYDFEFDKTISVLNEKITDLNLEYVNVFDDDIMKLKKFSLKSLHLGRSAPLTMKGIDNLIRVSPTLTSLSLFEINLHRDSCVCLGNINDEEIAIIRPKWRCNCNDKKESGIKSKFETLIEIPTLKNLTLKYCFLPYFDENLDISRNSHVTRLELETRDENDLKCIKYFNLKEMRLCGASSWFQLGEFSKYIEHLQLTDLNIFSCGDSNPNIQAIKNMPLKNINISFNMSKDDWLLLPRSLQSMKIVSHRFTGREFIHFKNLTSLLVLKIIFATIDSSYIEMLNDCPVKNIIFNECQGLTINALEVLRKTKSYLHIINCENINQHNYEYILDLKKDEWFY